MDVLKRIKENKWDDEFNFKRIAPLLFVLAGFFMGYGFALFSIVGVVCVIIGLALDIYVLNSKQFRGKDHEARIVGSSE